MKDFIINLSKEVISEIAPEEIEVFNVFSDGIYDNIINDKYNKKDDASHFGSMGEFISLIIMALIIDISKDLIKSGFDISKKTVLKLLSEKEKTGLTQNQIDQIVKILNENK